jgi:hypothetical protein
MKQILIALVLALAFVGCKHNDPNVRKGGGESVTAQADGVIAVKGHVVNTGSGTAEDVVLHFSFSQAGSVYFEQELRLGSIDDGEMRNFSVTFYGPAVDLATFAWDYTISWD